MSELEVDQNLVYGAAMERINHYGQYIRNRFGERVQKITVLGGFTCPNRDGTKGVGGCTYCNNESFAAPQKIAPLSILEQINHGIKTSKRRYKVKKYIVYFQAYSNTYASLDRLKALYQEALSHPDVVGLAIGTRADCIDEEKLDYLEKLATKYYITLEYGIESTHDTTLQKINRCHSSLELEQTLELSAGRGIDLCGHLILGFPWEDHKMIQESARSISKLPLDSLKIHQLHLVKGTAMAIDKSIVVPTMKQYCEALKIFIENLSPQIAIQRLYGESPAEMMLSPSWQTTASQFTLHFEKFLEEHGTFQGKYHINTNQLF